MASIISDSWQIYILYSFKRPSGYLWFVCYQYPCGWRIFCFGWYRIAMIEWYVRCCSDTRTKQLHTHALLRARLFYLPRPLFVMRCNRINVASDENCPLDKNTPTGDKGASVGKWFSSGVKVSDYHWAERRVFHFLVFSFSDIRWFWTLGVI